MTGFKGYMVELLVEFLNYIEENVGLANWQPDVTSEMFVKRFLEQRGKK
jgi:hypothetical protein